MVSGYCFGASYVYTFNQKFDWFVVAPALMTAHRVIIPYTGNKEGLTDTLIIQPFIQYNGCHASDDCSYETIRAVIRRNDATDGIYETAAEYTKALEDMQLIEQQMNAGDIPQFTLSAAQCAVVNECDNVLALQYGGTADKGWKTKWELVT